MSFLPIHILGKGNLHCENLDIFIYLKKTQQAKSPNKPHRTYFLFCSSHPASYITLPYLTINEIIDAIVVTV